MKSVTNLPTPPKYELFNHDTVKDFACFRVLSGQFAGLTFHFLKVSIGEDKGEGDVPLTFTYDIIDPLPDNNNKEEIDPIVCSILFDVIEQNAHKEPDENRNNNS